MLQVILPVRGHNRRRAFGFFLVLVIGYIVIVSFTEHDLLNNLGPCHHRLPTLSFNQLGNKKPKVSVCETQRINGVVRLS